MGLCGSKTTPVLHPNETINELANKQYQCKSLETPSHQVEIGRTELDHDAHTSTPSTSISHEHIHESKQTQDTYKIPEDIEHITENIDQQPRKSGAPESQISSDHLLQRECSFSQNLDNASQTKSSSIFPCQNDAETQNLQTNIDPMTSILVKSNSTFPCQTDVDSKNIETNNAPFTVSSVECLQPRMEAQAVLTQESFDFSIKCACDLLNPEEVIQRANQHVYKLRLQRALPLGLSVTCLLRRLHNLQVVDISGNQLGPVAVRSLVLGLSENTSIAVLNIADNQADTDTSDCIGRMLRSNASLECLDVSGNNLGTDFFSRRVGAALAENTSLRVLRCSSIGSTDFTVLAKSLEHNTTLTELILSHNHVTHSDQLVRGLARWLQSVHCPLRTLDLKHCGLKDTDLDSLKEGVRANTSLNLLNVSGAKVPDVTSLFRFICQCLCHPTLISLVADDIHSEDSSGQTLKFDATREEFGTTSRAIPSALQSLSLASSGITDVLVLTLVNTLGSGFLNRLNTLTLSNNPALTVSSIKEFHNLTKEEDATNSSLERLSWGLNSAAGLAKTLSSHPFPQLRYLNLRKAKISPTDVTSLASTIGRGGIETLVLDGVKLAGSGFLQHLLGDGCSLNALSLAGCQMTDKDLEHLTQALLRGLPLCMLKVSANRLTDTFLTGLVRSLLKHETHSLAVLDFSKNKFSNKGAKLLAELFENKQHKTQIHSLNISDNTIDAAGLQALLSMVSRSALTHLQASNQQCAFDEDDIAATFHTLADALGWTAGSEGGVETGTGRLPSYQQGLSVKLNGLGGNPGDLGQRMDCPAICTDFQQLKKPHLSLQDVLDLTSALNRYRSLESGINSDTCQMSSKDWSYVTSGDKDAPSWLQVSAERDRAAYLSHLPANITVQKLEGILEMEADCSVKEVYLCKDLLSRRHNGFGWVLFSDATSLQKAVDFYNKGEAVVLGTSFIISTVKIVVNNAAITESEAKARRDIERRLAESRREHDAHRHLIQESYQESQARHAYRLAHPAYADGRIW